MMSQKSGCDQGSGKDSGAPKAVGVVEERCPICLDEFRDKAFISSCFHSFCFECLVRASQVSGNTCPMCKTKFHKVIHNVRANDDYDMYEVPEMSSSGRQQVMQDLDEAIRNFRGYRTTMHAGRVPRGVSDALASNSSRNGSGSVLVHISLPSSAQHATSSRLRGAHREREFGMNIRRSGRCAPPHFRRAVYSAGVHALPLEAGSRRHKTRIISAAHFKKNPAGTHRLGPWLSREFEVLVGEDQVEFMMQLVLSLIDKVDLESELFGAHLEPFLNERTSHFMHELISFAKSPFDIIAYDSKVRYNWPANYPVPVGHSGGSRRGRTEGFQASLGQGPSTSSLSDASGSQSSMQQRIFSELVDDGIELDSCRVVDSSSSPIVIHGSDSESDESEAKRTKLDHSSMVTFRDGFPGPSSSHISSNRDQQAAVPVEETSSKSRPPHQHASLPSTSGSVDEISLFVDDADDYDNPSENFGWPVKGDRDDSSRRSSSRRSRKGKEKLGSSKSRGKDKQLRKSSRNERHHSPWSKSRHRSRDSSWDEEEREEKYRSRRKEKSRHAKEHRRSSSKDSSRDHDSKKHRAHRSSEDRHGKRKLDKHSKYHKRRSRSFSDSEEESSTRTSKRVRKHKHSTRSRVQRCKDSMDRGDSGGVRDQQEHSEAKGMCADDGTEEQLLIQEAKAIDDEIKASKREILKSALKRERIELLHSRRSSGEGGSAVGVAASVGAEESDTEQQVLQDELAQLIEKLVSEKRRLLKVVKHIEEEKAGRT